MCLPHPSSRVCMVQGNHLAGCPGGLSCAGCVACVRHNHPRPVQRPASTSDARKRKAERVTASRAALVARGKAIEPKTFELDEREATR